MLEQLWYYFVHIFFKILFTICSSLKIEGAKNLPKSGGYIVASNHTSYLDPPLISACLVKKIHFMAKKELFSSPFFSLLIRSLGAFPVSRDGRDLTPIKHAVSLLRKGKIVGIFPQGHRVLEEDGQAVAQGVTMIAKQAGVPIVPVGINGAIGSLSLKNIFGKRKTLKITIDEPIVYQKAAEKQQERENMKQFTDNLMNKIMELSKKE